jgi:hypothetical protein
VKKWVIASGEHESGLGIVAANVAPMGAMCEFTLPNDADIEVAEVVFRAKRVGKQVQHLEHFVRINPYLEKRRSLALGKKKVVVSDGVEQRVIEVPSNVKPQNYVRDAKSEEMLSEVKQKGWNEQTIIERIRSAFLG